MLERLHPSSAADAISYAADFFQALASYARARHDATERRQIIAPGPRRQACPLANALRRGGEGVVRPFIRFSVEDVRNFAAFLRDCGGFAIWRKTALGPHAGTCQMGNGVMKLGPKMAFILSIYSDDPTETNDDAERDIALVAARKMSESIGSSGHRHASHRPAILS